MKATELIRILRKDGWKVISQKGSHRKMIHPMKEGVLIVPFHGSQEVGKGLEKKILKMAGLKP